MGTLARGAQQRPSPVPVLDIGSVDVQLERTPVRVHEGVPLTALDLLARIVAARAGRLGALAVQHRSRWTGRASGPLAIVDKQMVVDRLPCPVIAEAGEPTTHRRERREAVGQHLPRAAGAQHGRSPR